MHEPMRSTLFTYTTLFRSATVKVNDKVAEDIFKKIDLDSVGKYGSFGYGFVLNPGEKLVLTLSRSEEHTSELQSRRDLVCRLLLEKKKKKNTQKTCLRSCF